MSEPSTGQTLVFLHGLGGSARLWRAVEARLAGRFRLLPIDLPGFGDAASLGPRDVAGMAAHVVASLPGSEVILVGHSMGAKVALAVARAAEDGLAGVAPLAGLVLLAGSPPSPEPFDEDRRADMLTWLRGDAARTRDEGERFAAANTGGPLLPDLHREVLDGLARTDPAAWRAWLENGSREDHASGIGVLRTPALLVAGGADADLGADNQARLMAPHLPRSRLVTLDGAAHLLPLERAEAVADLIAQFAREDRVEPPAPPLDAGYARLIASDRVSRQTRAALHERAAPDDPFYAPRAMSLPAFAVLRSVLARVVPQGGGRGIDLAARLDATMHAGAGDGWRFADLPPDAEAMRAALRALDGGRPFVRLDAAEQDRRLAACADGTFEGVGPGGLDGARMRLWFEDLRAMATQLYVAHPATLARLGHSGIAYGGDGPVVQGFAAAALGGREAWEPVGVRG